MAAIKTHSSVSVAKKTKEDAWYTSVLFTGTVKLPNSAFRISKIAKQICTKFIYFLPYINTTSHIKIEGNHFSKSWDICSWKLPDFLHLFLHTKLKIYLIRIKINLSSFDFFHIWSTNNAHLVLHFSKILKGSKLRELYTIIMQFFSQFVVAPTRCIINAMDLKFFLTL